MTAVRRRKLTRRRPDREPSLPLTVRIVLPPRHRISLLQALLAMLPIAVVLAGGYFAYKKFSAPPAEVEQPPELREVTIEAPPPPEPEPEPEAAPEAEAEPEAALPDLLSGSDGDLGPSTDISLDLALGTGSGGMAIGVGPKGAAGASAAKAAYEPGQAEKDPEITQAQDPVMPRQAMDKGVSGGFVATFVVNPQGRAENIQITGSPAGYGFEDAIRKALLKRRYSPAMAGGVAVPMKIRQPFDFRME
ncbi:MAG: energy transducer TonB [Fibrobacterota bacterium]|nr:energy transducer TonB [Fibrobacterota bacterium]